MKDYRLDKKTLQAILTKNQLGQLVSVEKFKTGFINPVFLINDKYVLRIEQHTYDQIANKLKKEAALFQLLPNFGIPTPEVIVFDESRTIIDTPYIMLAYIPGQSLKQAFKELDNEQQHAISYQMGQLALKIHSLTDGDLNSPVLEKVDQWVKKTNNDFSKYWSVVKDTDVISDTLKTKIMATFEQYLLLNLSHKGRLTHGDFIVENIQIHEGRIVGVFDFEYASIGDPLWDFQKLPISFTLGTGFSQEAFLRGYGKAFLSDEEIIRIKMHSYHQGVWEIWATMTQFMPLGKKELDEGVHILTSTENFDIQQ
jgi:aminoglycoside phosphotransferase (APT) family kinase protein